jgi:hypothetical protein
LPSFLIGAGFNADAAKEAGPVHGNSIDAGHYLIDCGYPLVADTAHLCFGSSQAPTDKSIEELFAETIKRNDYEPLKKLADRLMEADYRIAYRLATSETANCYREFFRTFDGADFLTFNYDSLPEIILHHSGRWFPHDGYGVPVEVETDRLAPATMEPAPQSTSLILHLHGSCCLYTTEFEIQRKPSEALAWLTPLARPRYCFDPDSVSGCFSSYRRMMSNTGYVAIEERVIAPVPDKAESLKATFVREMYRKAIPLVRECESLVAVGYSFNPYDRISYSPVLDAVLAAKKWLIVVAPDASNVIKRVAADYPCLRIKAIDKTFKEWAQESFHL